MFFHNIIYLLGHCRGKCKKKFSPSYEEETVLVSEKNVVFRKYYSPGDIFISTRETAFTNEFLNEVTWGVALSHTQFVNIAQVYNKMNRNKEGNNKFFSHLDDK